MVKSTTRGLGTLLRRLLELTDGELEAIYREEHPFYTPRFTPIMRALAEAECLTIRDLAEAAGTSHSAASQTVARMEQLGLLELVAGADRRSREVALSSAGRELLPWLRNRWRATNSAADALDRELSASLQHTVMEAIRALEARSFSQRIREHETSRQGGGQ
jgi:DNA-binding MarR family transcriptional regulator